MKAGIKRNTYLQNVALTKRSRYHTTAFRPGRFCRWPLNPSCWDRKRCAYEITLTSGFVLSWLIVRAVGEITDHGNPGPPMMQWPVQKRNKPWFWWSATLILPSSTPIKGCEEGVISSAAGSRLWTGHRYHIKSAREQSWKWIFHFTKPISRT